MQHLNKDFILKPPKLRLYQLKKNWCWDCASHTLCLERPRCDFDEYILCSSTKLADADPSGTADSCYGTKNEQKNTQNDVVGE